MGFLSVSLSQVRKQKGKRDLVAFNALANTPGDLSIGVTLPANGNLFASSSSELLDNTELVTINDRTLSAGASEADKVHYLGWFERGRVVTKKSGAPGTVSLYVSDGFSRHILIGEG